MTLSSKDAKKVKILVDKDVVDTSFEKWAKPGHFSRTLAKGPKTTTWIWNLHADAHDFDIHTGDAEEATRKIFSAHFMVKYFFPLPNKLSTASTLDSII